MVKVGDIKKRGNRTKLGYNLQCRQPFNNEIYEYLLLHAGFSAQIVLEEANKKIVNQKRTW